MTKPPGFKELPKANCTNCEHSYCSYDVENAAFDLYVCVLNCKVPENLHYNSNKETKFVKSKLPVTVHNICDMYKGTETK